MRRESSARWHGSVWREAPARWPELVAMERTVLGAGATEGAVLGAGATVGEEQGCAAVAVVQRG